MTSAATTSPPTLQQQARALGDPTRHSLFRHIADAGHPLGIAELTAHFRLNHNAIRQHLAKLVAARLVVETKAATTGPGRPRLLYAVDPSAEGMWGTGGPYERLSQLLAEIITTGLSAEAIGRRAAERIGVTSPSGDAVADMAATMARQGFDPEVRRREDGAEIILRNCPFASTASAARDTVCSIHLGIAAGLADGSSMVVEELVANDPGRAGCRLRLSEARPGSPPAAGGERLSLRDGSTAS